VNALRSLGSVATASVSLYRDPNGTAFTLGRQYSGAPKVFSSIGEATRHLASLLTQEAIMSVFDDGGQVLFTTRVAPKAIS